MTTATVIPERLERVQGINLRSGTGPEPNGKLDACVMQAVAYVAGEPWSDHPACASPAITAFCIAWNDSLDDVDRQMLKPYIPRIVGTNTGPAAEERRAWLAADWLARVFAPAWLRYAAGDGTDKTFGPLLAHAAALEALDELTSDELAHKAIPIIEAARSAAESAARSAARSAAESAARSAAWSAAESAAWSAARSAAESAAESAAWSAARSAAESAAWSAAWSAARKSLAPTVKKLQASALELLDRMIEVSQADEVAAA